MHFIIFYDKILLLFVCIQYWYIIKICLVLWFLWKVFVNNTFPCTTAMDSPRAREADTEDVELFQEFLDIKSQSFRNVDSDICPICFDSVQDNQVSVHV